MNRAVFFWYSIWVLLILWLLALVFLDSYVPRVVLLLWLVVSFVVKKPKRWPAFQSWVRRNLGPDAVAWFSLKIDADDFHAAVAAAEDAKRGCGDALDAAAAERARAPLLFTFAPHGTSSVNVNFLKNMSGLWEKAKLPDVSMLIGSGFWLLPLAREWYSFVGCLPVRPALVKALFRKRRDLGLVPGGFEEAVFSQPGTNELWIRRRKGFLKYALQGGYGVVPCFAFGEADMVEQVQLGKVARAKFAGATRIPAVMPKSLNCFPSKPVSLVVGAPLWLPTIAAPTPADIDTWHAKYLDAVQRLYDKHRAAHGAADIDLVMH